MPRQEPDHPHLHLHTASYPPATRGQYRTFPGNFSQNHTAPQPNRAQSYGNHNTNGRSFGHNTEEVYGNSLSQAHGTAFDQNPANGFYQNPYHQQFTSASSSPGTTSGVTLPDHHVLGTGQSEGTPPYTSSPMSAPLNFESQAHQVQMQYQQAQALQFPIRSSSGSSNSPDSFAHEQEYTRQGKRPRGLDEEEEFAFNLDVGMEHDTTEGQDNKEHKQKP